MKQIASFGCGVDSVAMVLLKSDYDEIIFADTGSEMPQTYAYLDYFEKKSGLKITKVKSHLGKIFDYYFDKRCFPLPTFRDCTKKFKITPIRQYLREKYGKKETFEMNLGIDYSEFHRMRESDVKYIKNKYPLVDLKLSREQLIEIIKSKGYEVPVKSGCYFCMFQKPKAWLNLKQTHPRLWEKAKALEKNSTMRLPLINLKGKDSQTLFECGCFNG